MQYVGYQTVSNLCRNNPVFAGADFFQFVFVIKTRLHRFVLRVRFMIKSDGINKRIECKLETG
jgi:hypothetical protein